MDGCGGGSLACVQFVGAGLFLTSSCNVCHPVLALASIEDAIEKPGPLNQISIGIQASVFTDCTTLAPCPHCSVSHKISVSVYKSLRRCDELIHAKTVGGDMVSTMEIHSWLVATLPE